jgi:lysocardiolipin and lysophospholipid acyltransferase
VPGAPLKESRGPVRRAVATARVSLVTVAGLASLLAVNLLQTSSLVLLPVSRPAFRRFNRWCANLWWGACVVAAERFNRTRVVVSGDVVPARENALLVVNHQQMPDITTIMAFARSKRRLGDLKFFVKRAIKWCPGIGWGMQFLACPFVRRDWDRDREAIARTFSTLVDERIPMWLVSFVEGTRLTTEKLARSQAYAREHGLEPLRHVLVPRTKGFAASVEGLGRHISAVYDLTIGYVEGVPTLWQYIEGSVATVHLHVRRFPVEELPRLEEELRAWLLERFREKDELLEHFYLHGSFPVDNLQPQS